MMPAVVNVTEQTVSRVTTALTDGVGDITQDLLRFKANQFHTALVDPPWRFENRTGKVAPEHQRLRRYRTIRKALLRSQGKVQPPLGTVLDPIAEQEGG